MYADIPVSTSETTTMSLRQCLPVEELLDSDTMMNTLTDRRRHPPQHTTNHQAKSSMKCSNAVIRLEDLDPQKHFSPK